MYLGEVGFEPTTEYTYSIDLQSIAFGLSATPPTKYERGGFRTYDLWIKNPPLYHLSYASLKMKKYYYNIKIGLQQLVPELLPCYDFVPITHSTYVRFYLKCKFLTISAPNFKQTSSRAVTGGVYKTKVRFTVT